MRDDHGPPRTAAGYSEVAPRVATPAFADLDLCSLRQLGGRDFLVDHLAFGSRDNAISLSDEPPPVSALDHNLCADCIRRLVPRATLAEELHIDVIGYRMSISGT